MRVIFGYYAGRGGMMAVIQIDRDIYADADAARTFLETLRWPEGAACPHCGENKRIKRLEGGSTRPGVLMCNPCRRPFTVTVATMFEDSKVPLHKWLQAFRLMTSKPAGVPAQRLQRELAVTYKTAWFMTQRIREAMAISAQQPMAPDPQDAVHPAAWSQVADPTAAPLADSAG